MFSIKPCFAPLLFVPLPLHLRCNGECGLRLSIARASSALRSPCTTLANENEDENEKPAVVIGFATLQSTLCLTKNPYNHD